MFKELSPCALVNLATLVALTVASGSSIEEINIMRHFFSQICSVLSTYTAQDIFIKKNDC